MIEEVAQDEAVEDVVIETGEEPEVEAKEPESKEPEAPEGFISKEDAQKDINRQHKKFRDEERARKKVEAEAERLRTERDELKAKTSDVTVPPPPDPYSENYADEIRARDEAIQQKAAHDVEVAQNEAAQARVAEQAKNDEQAALEEKVRSFDAATIQLGLQPGDVKKAADTVINYGISETLEDVIIEDPEGPLLVAYLASNPVELESLNGMSAYQLFNTLGELKAKASTLKPQTSQAPPPPDILEGGGGGDIEDPALKGVIYE